ncbi:MAG: type II toxin-antitoxin system Phd/YefM family antitoxin [Terriglobales bacterium]
MAKAKVGLRELRLDLRRVLARVKKGERVEITEHGQPVALLVPMPAEEDGLDRMIAEGRATRPTGDLLDLGPPPPTPPGWSSQKILDELREDKI